MIPATVAVQRPADAKLLVVDASGTITHHRRADVPTLVEAGDLLIANDAATLPASLSGVHVRTGAAIEVRLAGRRSLLPRDTRFTAVVFGTGDFHTPTEHRALPPALGAGDLLQLGLLRGLVVDVLGHPRLIEIEFQHSIDEMWEGLARHGRPIQYSYLSEPLAIWDTWTQMASLPVAFEAPSAGFILDWRFIDAIRARGARFAAITHAAGISATGDAALDARLPLDEPYFVPASTASLIDETRQRGGRIIAIGTTVVRALEDAAARDGRVQCGMAVATLRVSHRTRLRVVDVLVTGQHEPDTSHYELLRAFQNEEVLERAIGEANARNYRTHEFGDSLFIATPIGHAATGSVGVSRIQPMSSRGNVVSSWATRHELPRLGEAGEDEIPRLAVAATDNAFERRFSNRRAYKRRAT